MFSSEPEPSWPSAETSFCDPEPPETRPESAGEKHRHGGVNRR